MPSAISITALSKRYDGGAVALDDVSLEIEAGEILALLGPNGAGKTTLISCVCGLVTPSSGRVTVGGHDIQRDYRAARAMVGLVPQEISVAPFETVAGGVRFTRGLFGKPRDDAYIEKVLRSLSLWDKRDAMNNALSGGMRRRVLIAKALSHGPRVLFLDEPSAGVDVELRRDMWELVRGLREDGVTIILTTHYIEEAEELADRIGVIDKGRLLLVEDKHRLMQRMGGKSLTVRLRAPLAAVPDALAEFALERGEDGTSLRYAYDTRSGRTGITALLTGLADAGIAIADIETHEASLEDVFLRLVKENA